MHPSRWKNPVRSGQSATVAVAVAASLTLSALTLSPVSAQSAGPIGSTSSTALQADDLVANPAVLQDVPAEFGAKFRWWWPTDGLDKPEIDAELTAIKESGFAGVEQITLRNSATWGSPAFTESLRYSMTKAKELGLSFDLGLGPGYPTTSPAVNDVTDELSSQDLGYGSVDVAAGATYSGVVPDNAAPTASTHRRLIAVTAARVTSDAGVTPVVLDPDSSVNLTGRVVDGSITWTAPSTGTWKIYGFWMRPTMQTNNIAGGDDLVVDYLNRNAVREALKGYDTRSLDAVADLLREGGGDVFEDSIELEHGPLPEGQSAVYWTGDLIRDFTANRDYSPTKFLPGLFDEITFTDGADERLKNDYRTTVNDLLISDHLTPIKAWANAKGLSFRAQAYQSNEHLPTDTRRLSAVVDKADVESLGSGDPVAAANIPGAANPYPPGSAGSRAVIDRYRQVVSGARLGGIEEVSNELGASLFGAHRTDAGDLKSLTDHSLAAGVSRMVLHGFAYRNYTDAGRNSWLGWCAWCSRTISFADSWNQTWPQFKALERTTDYMGRAGVVVRTGKPQVDLTVLDDSADVNGSNVPDPAGSSEDAFRKALSDKAYTWDSISPTDLLDTGAVKDGRLLPDGAAYKAVVVNDQASLPAETAERLVTLAEAGLPVVVLGAVPSTGSGFDDRDAEDARVTAAVAQLRELASVTFAESTGDLAGALSGLDVTADIAGGIASDIVPVHRRTATGDVWFLYNNSTKALDGDVTFATTGAPSSVDLWTGEVTALGQYTRSKSTVTVPVHLDADGTAVVMFDRRSTGGVSVTASDTDEVIQVGGTLVARDTTGGPASFTMSDGSKRTATLPRVPDLLTIDTPWALSATTTLPGGSTETDLTLDALKDWKDIPELSGQSGKAVYTNTVDVPASWLAQNRGVRLRLGDFAGAVRVWVNGTKLPVSEVPKTNELDVTDGLVAGSNDVKIELSTTLNNAFRTAAKTDSQYGNLYFTLAELPAGLLGPVQLVPYGQAAVAATPVPPKPTTPAPAAKATKTTIKLSPSKITAGKRAKVTIRVTSRGTPTGKVQIRVKGKLFRTVALKNGRATVRLSKKLPRGKHSIRAVYLGTKDFTTSDSRTVRLRVTKK